MTTVQKQTTTDTSPADPFRPTSEPATAPDSRCGAPGSTRFLIAEDNVVNQKVAVAMLARLGFRADCVANGREAVEACSSTPYDIVFMDVQMPELDGYEATRQIRSANSERGPTIVAMTANAMEGDRKKALASGMDDYISKPIGLDRLAQITEKYSNPPDRS